MSLPDRSSRFRFRALALVAIGVVVLGAAAVALRIQQLRGQARTEVARALHDALGFDTRVADASFDFSDFSLVARGIELRQQGRLVLGARALHVRSSLGTWLAGRVELRSVEIVGATLDLTTGDAQRLGGLAAGGHRLLQALSIRDLHGVFEAGGLGRLELEHATLKLTTAGSELPFQLIAAHARLKRADALAAEGQLKADGRLRQTGQRTEGAGQLQLEQARVLGGPGGQRVELKWSSDARHVELQGTWTLAAAGALAFNVTAPLDGSQPVELRVQPHALQLRAALSQLGLSAAGVDAVFDGDATLRGTIEPLVLSGPARVDARGVHMGGGASPASGGWLALASARATANLRIDASAVALDALRIEVGAPTKGAAEASSKALRGQARIGFGGQLSATLGGDAVDLGELSPIGGVALAGHGRVQLQASGALRAPDLHAVVALDGAALAGFELGKASAELDLEEAGSVLRFSRAEILDHDRKLVADSLALRLDSGVASAQARVRAVRLPLTELYRALGAADDPILARLQGRADGSVELGYTRSEHTQKLDLTLAFELADANLDDYRFDRGRLRAHVALPDAAHGFGSGVLTLSELSLSAEQGRVGLSGEMERGALSMRVAIEKLPLHGVPWLRTHFHALDGRLDGQGSLKGSGPSTQADMELALSDLQLSGHKLGDAKLSALLRDRAHASEHAPGKEACERGRAALAGGQLGAQGKDDAGWLICGSGLADRLHVDLALGAGDERALRGGMNLEGFDLATFMPEQSNGAHTPGKLSASLEFSAGGLARPDRITARLEVRKLQFGEGTFALANRAPFELHVREGALAMEQAALEGPRLALGLSAEGSLQQTPRLVLSGTAAAGLFSGTLAEAFGDVDVRLEWNPTHQPSVRGEAKLRDVLVKLEAGAYVRKLHGKLLLEGERVQLDGVGAELGGGSLQFDGGLQLTGTRVSNYEFAIKARDVSLEPQPRLELTLDAQTSLTWPGGAVPPKLAGALQVKRVLYLRHIQLPEALTSLNRQDRSTQAAYTPAHDRLAFDLEIEQQGSLRVRNNFLDAELSVIGADHKLRVVGSDQRFGILGKLAITHGRVLYRGDEFQVARGEVSFDDEHRVAPTFEVRAVSEKRKRPDTSVVLVAHGTRDTFNMIVHCDAGAVGGEPPPFSCEYAHDDLRCDNFDRLVQQWLCRAKPPLSSAETTR